MTGSGWQTRTAAKATGLLRLDYKLDPIGATFYGRPFCTVTCVTPTSASIAVFKHYGGQAAHDFAPSIFAGRKPATGRLGASGHGARPGPNRLAGWADSRFP